MSKTSDALRSIKVFNTHGVLSMFSKNKKQVIAVQAIAADHGCGGHSARVRVWSPHFHTGPNEPWYNHKCKTFVMFRSTRKETITEALAWAEKQYGISEWGTCPTDRNTKIPLAARKRALEAAKNAKAE